MKIQELRKVKEELKRSGGLKGLTQKLDADASLEERAKRQEAGIQAMRNTRTSLDENMRKRLEEDRLAQERHEHFVQLITAESAQLMNQNDFLRSENAQLRKENAALTSDRELGLWFMKYISKDKKAVQDLAKYVSNPSKYHLNEQPAQLTDDIRKRLVTKLGDELTENGFLVPIERLVDVKMDLAKARKETFLYRITAEMSFAMLATFVHQPLNMTADQKRVLLWSIKQINHGSWDGIPQLVTVLQNSESCTQHRVAMVFDYQRARWVCPVFNCTSRK